MSYSAAASRLPVFLRRHILHFEMAIEDALADFARDFIASDCARFGVVPGSEDDSVEGE